jgi:hypothetical protein
MADIRQGDFPFPVFHVFEERAVFERKEGPAVICDRLLVFMFIWQGCWLELGSTNVPKIY